ncbi:hypothetical protein ACXYTJ_00400 [Gilvimarinus sp. F26214L]|uniref:hypothetical protein n=1 Tax=Gilvimarinus sp. DZF01 TaxID=3461371 RepID=UPI004045DD3B
MAIIQWVNLEKNEAYAKDPDIGSVDRCGPLSIKALFAKDGVPLSFSVRAVPAGKDNVEYSEAEQNRNPNFKMPKDVSGLASEKEVLLDGLVKLPAAGGNKYKLEATDANGTTVQSVEVEAKRKLYYQVMSMSGPEGRVPSYSLSPMENHAEKHSIVLSQEGAPATIPYRKCLAMHSGGNLNKFGGEVAKAYTLTDPYKKVGIAAVFSDYIASMKEHDYFRTLAIGGSAPGISVSEGYITITGDRYLWHGLDDEDDKEKKWFVLGAAFYSNPSGGPDMTYRLKKENVSITGSPRFPYGGFHQIKIKRDDSLNSLLAGKGGIFKIGLKVNIVNGWTNGFSWSPGGNDLITCARRTRWRDMPAETREYTWNHEVGHRFGMVAFGHRTKVPGSNKLPDGPPTLYGENRGVNDYGHQGPHCGAGATYSPASGWSGAPGCVMFGANGTGEKHAPKEYCGACAKVVRKVDLA